MADGRHLEQEGQHSLTEQRAANFSVPWTHHCDVTN